MMSVKKMQPELNNALPHSELMHDSAAIYSVYIHHKIEQNDIENLIYWEKRETTKNKEKAIKSAKSLYKSYDCNKIEIKKTYHSPKHGKMIDKTIKVYGEEPKNPITNLKIASIIALITALSTTIAFWIWS